jgi:hypothetical protein
VTSSGLQTANGSVDSTFRVVPYERLPVVPGKVDAVGVLVPLDGRITWVPASARGYQPSNTYVVQTGEGPVIVDPGVAVAEAAVVDGVVGCLPADAGAAVVFLTRGQLDVTGNLGALVERVAVKRLYAGGRANRFDQFDAAPLVDARGRAAALAVDRVQPGAGSSAGAFELEIVTPPLRILSTFWAYHPPSRTLFTSDSFTHVTLSDVATPPIVTDGSSDTTTLDDVRGHLLATFWWLETAVTEPIVRVLEEIFASRPVEVIAPGRGAVLSGSRVVERHVGLVLDVLRRAR